jgi:Tol biopolymer transport system component
MPLEPGFLLHNRYTILGLLGSGGMGAVYRGRDESLGIEVAVKENLFVSKEAESQFLREAHLLAALRHAHLPRVTDHFILPGQGQYLVMDFVAGEDGKALLERAKGPLPVSDVLGWALEILDALQYLHSQQPPVIHRDVKPGNVKVTPEGRAMLVDFGLAKTYDVARTTTTGAKAFTPGFAPPEQYGLGRTDVRTDVYALGATLYALLSGVVPADGLERAMGHRALIPLTELNPAVPADVAQVIEHALAVKPEGRFPDAHAFAEALASAIAPAGVPTVADVRDRQSATPTAVRAVPAPVPVRRGVPWLGIGLGLAGVSVVTGIAVLLVATGVLHGNPLGLLTPAGLPSSTPPAADIAAKVMTEVPPAVATAEKLMTSLPPLGLQPTPQPTLAPTWSPPPVPTPIGGGSGEIAFVSERTGLPQIFRVGIQGGTATQLTTLPDGACQPAWSPDGNQLLFVTPCRGRSDELQRQAIYSMNPDGTNVQPLIIMVGGAFDPDWSETGIAFANFRNNQLRIWVAPPSGVGPAQTSHENSADRQPSWSPQGDKMAFMNVSAVGTPVILWMYKDGSYSGANPDQVTRDVKATTPDWSPSGDLIAYVVNSDVWVVKWDIGGFGAAYLTVDRANADPDWSPDGQWMAYESWHSGNHDVFIMTANGGQQTRLTDDPAKDYQPAWRP